MSKNLVLHHSASDTKTKTMTTFSSVPCSNSQTLVSQKEVAIRPIEGTFVEIFGPVFSYLISKSVLVLSYLMLFFTIPVSIWFCFKNLPQWERIVVYRLGKLQGVKGPGSILTIPWLDECTKLDLRTKLIGYPSKQFLTRDQAIVEAGCNISYRICDPVMYVNNIQDPELVGLTNLAAAVSLKHIESSDLADLKTKENILCVGQRIQQELSVVTSAWGIEISSVEISPSSQFIYEHDAANGSFVHSRNSSQSCGTIKHRR